MTCLQRLESTFGIVQWGTKFRCHYGFVLGGGTRHSHSSPLHSRQVEEVVGGSRFLSVRLFIVLFGALIEDILLTIALGVETGSKFSDVYCSSHPSPSYKRLQAVNNCIYWPQDHSSRLVKNADPQASLYLGEFSHVMSQLNICCFVCVCVFFWIEDTVIC